MSVLAAAPPTIEDARRAASALQAEGLVRVILFGSVARGEATARSDIDLIAVFSDLGDYRGRYELKTALSSAAEAASGRSVDVHVTDLPEWRKRSKEVTASFEASLGGDLIVLTETCPAPSEIDWGKEVKLPDTNLKEAETWLLNVRNHCNNVADVLKLSAMEGVRNADEMRSSRVLHICGEAARAIEAACKMFVALEETPPDRTHIIDELLSALRDANFAERLRKLIADAGISHEAISQWHTDSNYPDDQVVVTDRANAQKSALANLAGSFAVIARDRYVSAGGDDQAVLEELDAALDLVRRDGPQALGSAPVFPPLPEAPASLWEDDPE